MDEVLIIDNFLTTKECDTLLKLWDSTPFDPQDHPKWKDRVKMPKYPAGILKKLTDKRLAVSEEFFKEKLEIRSMNLTVWETGDNQSPHSDAGINNEFPGRKYASIIYLNDNFTGGETYIKELGFINTPKKGQLISFPGIKYMHGVTAITEGRRFTNICWLREINFANK